MFHSSHTTGCEAVSSRTIPWKVKFIWVTKDIQVFARNDCPWNLIPDNDEGFLVGKNGFHPCRESTLAMSRINFNFHIRHVRKSSAPIARSTLQSLVYLFWIQDDISSCEDLLVLPLLHIYFARLVLGKYGKPNRSRGEVSAKKFQGLRQRPHTPFSAEKI